MKQSHSDRKQMRLAFVAVDIPVFAFVAYSLARHMAKATVGTWNRRYIHGHSRWIQKMPIQDEVHRLDVHTDCDCSQDQDRKSVSCVVTMMGTHCLRVQVATHTAPALSSGEAEFVAQVKGASVGIGMQYLARDMGRKVLIRLHTDSTASRGVASRKGLGDIRHLPLTYPNVIFFGKRGCAACDQEKTEKIPNTQ